MGSHAPVFAEGPGQGRRPRRCALWPEQRLPCGQGCRAHCSSAYRTQCGSQCVLGLSSKAPLSLSKGGELIWQSRQGFENRLIQRLKQFPAGLAQVAHEPVIEFIEKLTDGPVQVGQAEESSVSQSGNAARSNVLPLVRRPPHFGSAQCRLLALSFGLPKVLVLSVRTRAGRTTVP